MGVHVFRCTSWTTSHLPPRPIPLGHPSAPAPSTLSHASNLDWRSVSHMIIYMFQCYALKSSHPRLLPQSPKVCSLHLCLFRCLAYRVIVTIFLNSIYMRWYTVLVFFFLTLLCIMGSSFIHVIRTDSNAFFLIAEWYFIVDMYHSFLVHSVLHHMWALTHMFPNQGLNPCPLHWKNRVLTTAWSGESLIVFF